MAKLTVNELLCFLSFYGDKLGRNNLSSVISEFYKQLLISECNILGLSNEITEFKKKRINTKEDALQKVTKDILDIWEVIDCQRGGETNSAFVASDPSRLPSVEAEKIDINGLTTIIFQLQQQIATLTNIVTRIDKRADSDRLLNDSVCSLDQPPFSPRSLPVTPVNTEEDINSALRKSSRKQTTSAKQRLNSLAQPFVPPGSASAGAIPKASSLLLRSSKTKQPPASFSSPALSSLPSALSASPLAATLPASPNVSAPISLRQRAESASHKIFTVFLRKSMHIFHLSEKLG